MRGFEGDILLMRTVGDGGCGRLIIVKVMGKGRWRELLSGVSGGDEGGKAHPSFRGLVSFGTDGPFFPLTFNKKYKLEFRFGVKTHCKLIQYILLHSKAQAVI